MSDIKRARPLRVGDEPTMLRQFLDYFRATLLRQCEGLDQAELATRLPGDHPSALTLAGLLKHLTYVEDWWFGENLLGLDARPPFDAVDWRNDPDWEFRTAADDDPAALRREFLEAVARSDAALDATPDLDTIAVRKAHDGTDISLRWILVHMVEEYARHCGHADLLREAIDGRTDL